MSLRDAARRVDSAGSNFEGPDWKQLIEEFRDHKSTGPELTQSPLGITAIGL